MKALVIRLSSMGDLILATSFLESLPENARVDWVISKEFAFVLKGHPKISNLIEFDKKLGLMGWIKFTLELAKKQVDVRYDLHSTLRSRLAFIIFRVHDLLQAKCTPHKRVKKERLKTILLFMLKRLAPHFLIPTPYWKRFSQMARGQGLTPPSYWPILNASAIGVSETLLQYQLQEDSYYVVMPASKWESKEWGAQSYLSLVKNLRALNLTPVILGRSSDRSCQELAEGLSKLNIPYVSVLSETEFAKTALIVSKAAFYVGGDTGLAHLAESLGVKAYMIFGPTRPELGFGPWKKESRAIYSSVLCSPCSKDGRTCFRLTSPYACMTKLDVESVMSQMRTER